MSKTIQTKAGTLTILEEYKESYYCKARSNQKLIYYKLKCYCGKVFNTQKKSIFNGDTNSCGCYNKVCSSTRKFIHGHGALITRKKANGKKYYACSRTYASWSKMKIACSNPGALGIIVCEKWQSFVGFLEDMGEKPLGYKFSRKDKSGDFEPDNCEWVPIKSRVKK